MVRHKSLLLVAALGWLSASCSTSEQASDPAPQPKTIAVSTRGNLRFKGPERLNNDLAAALELSPDAVCNELGQYPCASLVHSVALGGVDPYGTGLYEASGVTASTTPLVVERIVWAACTKRVDTDLASPASAVVFRGIPLSGAKLASPDGDDARRAITELTQRGFLREPLAPEIARYVQLAKDIEATGNAEPARAWMQSVCFAVFASAEAVFY